MCRTSRRYGSGSNSCGGRGMSLKITPLIQLNKHMLTLDEPIPDFHLAVRVSKSFGLAGFKEASRQKGLPLQERRAENRMVLRWLALLADCREIQNESVRPKTYDRMISERRQIAERFLSEGNGEAARICGNPPSASRESLGITYPDDAQESIMRPDFIFFRRMKTAQCRQTSLIPTGNSWPTRCLS